MSSYILQLTRCAEFEEAGVFGRLRLIGPEYLMPILATVERPWKNNELSISCIPKGVYAIAYRHYNKGNYAAIEVLNVPGRTHILFHKANWAIEVEGCIAVGKEIRGMNGTLGVTRSGTAFGQLMEAIERVLKDELNTLELHITSSNLSYTL